VKRGDITPQVAQSNSGRVEGLELGWTAALPGVEIRARDALTPYLAGTAANAMPAKSAMSRRLRRVRRPPPRLRSFFNLLIQTRLGVNRSTNL